MKKSLILVLILFVFLFSGCAGSSEVKASLGQEVSLPVGQTVVITEQNLKIRFIEVSEDSRCPKDVTCVWEGMVSAVVEISADGSSQQLKLIQPGLTEKPAIETHRGYQLTFKVEPYPEEGKEIAANEYELVLTVCK